MTPFNFDLEFLEDLLTEVDDGFVSSFWELFSHTGGC
jgi:hypothetical protein